MAETKKVEFDDLSLDERILKAIAVLGWINPTLIQEKTIPLLLEGKDVLVRARTGSGKTAAFSIPLIQKILSQKQISTHQKIKGLILAPSKELCYQISNVIKDLTLRCDREVKYLNIANEENVKILRQVLIEKPDIIIGTPAKVLQHIAAGNIDLKDLETVVIDEADLMFSFGYEDDVKKLIKCLPTIYQAVLASATLSDDVKRLKKIVLNNPVTLKLEEPDLAPASQLTHYVLKIEEIDKAAILYSLLKLHLLRGKTIIFVNNVDKCYKLKLYLEQFAIPTCVLNSELPAAIRCQSVDQFNNGIYDIIVASDVKILETPGNKTKVLERGKKSKRRKDKYSGVSRGIDFQFVSNVVNFDFPLDVDAYIHRAGRTARGNNEGSVLSFVSLREQQLLEEVESKLKEGQCDDTLIFKAYQFKLEEIEPFKYRAKDAWRAVTKIAIREARLKEIKQEIFNCKKLKNYFEANPTDLQVLRHDKALHTVKIQEHLRDVPDYMVPATLKSNANIGKRRKRKYLPHSDGTINKFNIQKNNPLGSTSLDATCRKLFKKI